MPGRAQHQSHIQMQKAFRAVSPTATAKQVETVIRVLAANFDVCRASLSLLPIRPTFIVSSFYAYVLEDWSALFGALVISLLGG